MTGLVMVGLGMAWDRLFPINKYLWSSSYTLYTAGLATVTLILFMLIPEKWLRKWGAIFISAGKNPLILFVASILWVKTLSYVVKWLGPDGNSHNAYQWIYQDIFIPAFGQANGSVVFALVNVLLFLMVGWFLDKRGLFLRL